MKILVLHNFLWAHYKNVLYEQLQKEASANRHELLVVQFARNEKSRASMSNVNTPLPNYNLALLHDGFIEDIGQYEMFRRIRKTSRAFKPDIVNITGFYSITHILTIIYFYWKGIPMILSNDSTVIDNAHNKAKNGIKRILMKLFVGYFVYGKKAAEYIVSLGGDKEKILVDRSAVVDNAEIKTIAETQNVEIPIQKTNYFVFAGRLISIKGVDVLLQAFSDFSKQFPDWGLIIVGDGDRRTSMEAYCNENQLPVYFAGGKSWNQVPPYLGISQALLLPSESEPWGLVVNEAMACGKAVVVSDKCGCASELVIEGQTGFTFESGNANDLLQKMIKMASDEAFCIQMGQNAQLFIEQYSPKVVAQNMIFAFEKFRK